MKRRLGLIAAIAIALFLGSSLRQERASAQFFVPVPVPGGPYYGAPGVPVTFSGYASTSYGFGLTTMEWNFGDGTAGFGPTVSHTYLFAGTYVVTLTATDPSGLTNSAATTAVIGGGGTALQVDAGGPYAGNVGTALTFSSSITVPNAFLTTGLQYSWTFGDGSSGAGATTVHVYSSAGTFPVTVTVTGLGSSAAAQTTATITAGLQVSAGISTSGKVGTPLPFNASVVGATNPRFTWTFGDGASASGGSVTHSYLAPGSYTVTVTVVDLATGQQDADSITANIGPGMTVDANGPYSGVVGSPIQVAATVNGATNPQYRWDFGDGGTGAGPSPTHVYEMAGSFTIALQVTDPTTGQAAQDTANVSVQPGGPLVSYPAGWNLVGAPGGTPFTRANSPLYTWQPGDTEYEVLRAALGVQGGYGYWVYFAQPTTLALTGISAPTASLMVPAGDFVMVGNPSATAAVPIHGATYALGWDPQSGQYKQVSALAPGAAAWVYVNDATVVTLGP